MFKTNIRRTASGYALRALNVNVYGYCLMTNYLHLILDPKGELENIGKLMKRLAGRQTRYVNHQENTSGSLLEGRYKSSAIEADAYLLSCYAMWNEIQ